MKTFLHKSSYLFQSLSLCITLLILLSGSLYCRITADSIKVTYLQQNWTEDGQFWKSGARITDFFDPETKLILRNLWEVPGDTGWINDGNHEYYYNSENKRTDFFAYEWLNSQWVYTTWDTYKYDSSWNLTEQTEFNFNDSVWVNYTRKSYKFDTNNLKTEYLFELWSDEEWKPYSRFTYQYNESQKLTEELKENFDTAWYNDYIIKYEYDNGNMIRDIAQNWDGNQWVNTYMESYSYNTAGLVMQRIEETWSNTEWRLHYKDDFSYNENNLQTEHLEYSWITGEWFPRRRTMTEYDNEGNMLFETVFIWIEGWVNYERTILEALTGVEETGNFINNISIFPNPPSDFINVSLPEKMKGNFDISIYNLPGIKMRRAVYQKLSNDGTVRLDVSKLPRGIYFININEGDECHRLKFVK